MWIALLAAAHAAPGSWMDTAWRGTSLALGTTAPVQAGVHGRVDIDRVRVGLAFGVLPGGYENAILAVARDAGWLTDSESELIATSLDGAWVVAPEVGWRPSRDLGLGFDAGFGLGFLGGGATTIELIEAATGRSASVAASGGAMKARATVLLVQAGPTWTFAIARKLDLEAGVGWTSALSAHSRVDADFPVPDARRQAVERVASGTEVWLDEQLRSTVHTPTLTLRLRVRPAGGEPQGPGG